MGPILNYVGLRRSEEWLREWLSDPQTVKAETKMPKFDFTPEEFEEVILSLSSMQKTVDTDRIISGSESLVEKGGKLFRAYDCLACHRLGREGRFVGPDLTWLGLRKTRTWERVWLRDPAAFKPGTFMPNFHLTPEMIEPLSAYLETLRGQANEDSQAWEFMINLYLNNKAARRGELVFKRLACWACHGEEGRGGVRNPNASPNELMPPLSRAAIDHSLEELMVLLSEPQIPQPQEPSADPPPFFCPDYSQAVTEEEFIELYAYLESIAPKKSKWKIH